MIYTYSHSIYWSNCDKCTCKGVRYCNKCLIKCSSKRCKYSIIRYDWWVYLHSLVKGSPNKEYNVYCILERVQVHTLTRMVMGWDLS